MGFEQELNTIFYPKSIALIGATNNKRKVGNEIAKNLKNYDGQIFFINKKEEFVEGKESYGSVLEVKDQLDLAIISIPAAGIPEVLEECGKKNITAVVVISAGFSEIGNVEEEKRIADIAKKYGIHIIGPNSVGIMNNENGLNATFIMNSKRGHIGFLSQSGALGAAIIYKTVYEDIGFSKFVSLGNMVDINFCTLLEYLAHDKDTKSVALYVEGVEDGKRFIESAKVCTRIKPVIALKSGRSISGARATTSHTGSLAGMDTAYDAAFKQSGIIRANNIDELLDFAKVFSMPLLEGNKVAILTNAGGPGILAADECENQGLEVPALDRHTTKKLREVLSAYASVKNPIDTIAQADYHQYYECLKILQHDANINALLSIVVVPTFAKIGMNTHAKAIVDGWDGSKPIISCFMSGEIASSSLRYTHVHNIPSYPSPGRAAMALGALWKYSKWYHEHIDQNKNI